MKIKIADVSAFKAELIQAIISEWKAQAGELEHEAADRVAQASENPSRNPAFSEREIAEQEARSALSAAKTPLTELIKLAKVLPEQGKTIGDFSLFDLTVAEVGRKTTVTTYFVLPLDSFERQVGPIEFQGAKIVLLNRNSEYFGKHLNYTKKNKGGEIFNEVSMGHEVSTGRFSKDVSFKVTWVYC